MTIPVNKKHFAGYYVHDLDGGRHGPFKSLQAAKHYLATVDPCQHYVTEVKMLDGTAAVWPESHVKLDKATGQLVEVV